MTALPPDEVPAPQFEKYTYRLDVLDGKVLFHLPKGLTVHLTPAEARQIGGHLFFIAADALGVPRPGTITLHDNTSE